MSIWLLPALIVGATIALAVPLGFYLAWIVDGRYRPPSWLRWAETNLDTGGQTWKQYAVALLLFNTLLFGLTFALLSLQALLPLNPDRKGMLAPTTIFHTTISFVTCNSQQHYAGEQHLSYFSQLVTIVGNMFLSGGVSLCAAAAVIRGLRGDPHLGNFYLDLWRGVVYVLLPLSLIFGILFLALGTPMTIDGAVLAGPTEQRIARGPVAALVPIKNLASVGGGFFGANSAHPFENASAGSNFLTCLAILLLPFALMVMFGHMLRQRRHATILFAVQSVLLAGMLVCVLEFDGRRPNPALTSLPVDQQATGNLEGKELRFGQAGTASCVAATTAVSCGAVDCMHDSLNPLAQLVPLAGMWLNCVFGGKGTGLLNLLLVLIVTVFLTGLLVGRTPEYLGKKVEAREMKLAMLALLVHPFLILAPTALFLALPWGAGSASNPGPHGLTQVIYEFSSAAAGNGSGMEGLGDTWGLNDSAANPSPAPFSPHWDVATGVVMLLGRFFPFVVVLALAGSLMGKPAVAATVGTLRTDTVTFGMVLFVMVLLLGALAFLPSAALGPLAEHFGPMPFGK